jgi:predicted PurR-regulated permease PerM
LLGDILGKMVKSYATLIFVTFCEVSIGLNILKLIGVYGGGYIIAISVVTAIVDILPVLGTGTILIPWAVYSLFTGNVGLGIGLIVLYALITVIRQILEPRLVSMNVGIHPVITLLGMYLGVRLFGVFGIFILPITFFLIKALNDEGIIHLWGQDKKANK